MCRADKRGAAQRGLAKPSDQDRPLLDLSDATVNSEEVSSEQIEDTMSMLSDMGITVVETEPHEEGAAAPDGEADDYYAGGRSVATAAPVPAITQARTEPAERTDDPVRMYLRDMGSLELLSREGEIAIARRIEAGREAMIAGLCESPLTFQAIIIWRDELMNAKILLRDIIDLEATYEGPEANAAATVAAAVGVGSPPAPPAVPPVGVEEGGEGRVEGELDDEDEYENTLSLAATEAELKPKVLETFDNIAASYMKLRKLQDKKVEMQVASEQFNRSQQRGYDKLRDEIIDYVKGLACRSTAGASRAWLSNSTRSTSVWWRTRAASCAWPTATACRDSSSSTNTLATSWTRHGSIAWRRAAARSGCSSSSTSANKSIRFAPTSTR
jgi:RNA polymerase primary sigma factor